MRGRCCLALAGLACGALAPGCKTSEAPVEPASFAQELLELVNDQRAKGATCGRLEARPGRLLRADPGLTRLAQLFSHELTRSESFSHTDARGRSPAQRAEDQHVQGFLGEALVRGARSAREALDTLMESERHCRTLMSSDACFVGISFVSGSSERAPSQVSYLVVETGLGAGCSP